MKHFLLATALTLLSIGKEQQSRRAQVCNDQDNDGDGWSCLAGDCNDFDNQFFPGAPEICNNADNNCDGTNDNLPDGDGDGFNLCQGDCADNDAARFPGERGDFATAKTMTATRPHLIVR